MLAAGLRLATFSESFFGDELHTDEGIVAVEHAMLIAIWNMLSTGTLYNDPGADFYTRLNPDKAKNRALDQLRRMGCDVTLNPHALAG